MRPIGWAALSIAAGMSSCSLVLAPPQTTQVTALPSAPAAIANTNRLSPQRPVEAPKAQAAT